MTELVSIRDCRVHVIYSPFRMRSGSLDVTARPLCYPFP